MSLGDQGSVTSEGVIRHMEASRIRRERIGAHPARKPLLRSVLCLLLLAGCRRGIRPSSMPAAGDAWAGLPGDDRRRFGAGMPREAGAIGDYAVEQVRIGWVLDWWVDATPATPPGVTYWQMVRVSASGYAPDRSTIRAAAQANPGATWILGNEPDVEVQDNVSPEVYAERYHELYALLKDADPSCRVAVAGVAQPTPLRLDYLDRVLAAYLERHGKMMPVDVWTVHGFVLREERDSWGVGIPPGFDQDTGALYELQDHDSVSLFSEQIRAFRAWMAERGYRHCPLALTEFGILMPEDYGFDEERVRAYMVAALDDLVTARDPDVGCPEDDNRLVQAWAWYSLVDTTYPTGNLFDPQSKALTALGQAYGGYEMAGGPN